jgi:hypothetical protein
VTYAKHFLDIYDVDLRLATTPKQWRKLAAEGFPIKRRVPQAAGQTKLAVWKPRKGLHVPCVILWVNLAEHTSPAELVNTCAHEATHAAGMILNRIGHEGPSGDEPRAYLTAWLTSWMWERMPARARGNGKPAS